MPAKKKADVKKGTKATKSQGDVRATKVEKYLTEMKELSDFDERPKPSSGSSKKLKVKQKETTKEPPTKVNEKVAATQTTTEGETKTQGGLIPKIVSHKEPASLSKQKRQGSITEPESISIESDSKKISLSDKKKVEKAASVQRLDEEEKGKSRMIRHAGNCYHALRCCVLLMVKNVPIAG